jgi:hypothetical protein
MPAGTAVVPSLPRSGASGQSAQEGSPRRKPWVRSREMSQPRRGEIKVTTQPPEGRYSFHKTSSALKGELQSQIVSLHGEKLLRTRKAEIRTVSQSRRSASLEEMQSSGDTLCTPENGRFATSGYQSDAPRNYHSGIALLFPSLLLPANSWSSLRATDFA